MLGLIFVNTYLVFFSLKPVLGKVDGVCACVRACVEYVLRIRNVFLIKLAVSHVYVGGVGSYGNSN